MAQLTIQQFLGYSPDDRGRFIDHMARFGQHVDTVLGSVARTDYPWDIPGGWEGWFQVEFATYLTMNNIDHERENGIRGYGTPDFLFSNGSYVAPIEIKCYHPGSNITQDALADVVKLQQTKRPYGLVIAVTPDGPPNGSFHHAHTLTGTVDGVNPPNMEIYYSGQ
jgi:hypothetical protein